MLRLISQPSDQLRLGEYLISHLKDSRWTHFRAAIAFVKESGVKHIADSLSQFIRRGGKVTLSVGVDHGVTTQEGMRALFEIVKTFGEIWVCSNRNSSTFHPKIYLFDDGKNADLIVGSGNLTEGGLFTNYEASLLAGLDITSESGAALFEEVRSLLNGWTKPDSGLAQLLSETFFRQLVDRGYLPTEARARPEIEADRPAETSTGPLATPLFKRIPVPRAPRVEGPAVTVKRSGGKEAIVPPLSPIKRKGFLMTLQRTDVGLGQTSPGKSRRSPELFVPLAARDHTPDFWGWPDKFTSDPAKKGKLDRRDVKMRIGTEIVSINMMTWPDKHDFRLRSETLRSAGSTGDVLRIEKAEAGERRFSYYVEIIPKGTSLHAAFEAQCTNAVRNSRKRWGYY